jgi:hypothetical protein
MDYTLDTTGGLLYVTATKNLKIGVGTGTVTGGTGIFTGATGTAKPRSISSTASEPDAGSRSSRGSGKGEARMEEVIEVLALADWLRCWQVPAVVT